MTQQTSNLAVIVVAFTELFIGVFFCLVILLGISTISGNDGFFTLPNPIVDFVNYVITISGGSALGLAAYLKKKENKVGKGVFLKSSIFGAGLAVVVVGGTVTHNQISGDAIFNNSHPTYDLGVEVDEIEKGNVHEKNSDYDVIREFVNNLSDSELRRNFGQLFFVGTNSSVYHRSPSSNVSYLVEEFNVGGLIFYDTSVPDSGTESDKVSSFISLLNDVKGNNLDNDRFPLFLATDHEGGNASPLVKAGIMTPIPAAMALGGTRDISAARAAGGIIGSEMAALGLNMNFAPVVDVSISSDDTVILDRSYGADQNLVSEMAEAFMTGIAEKSIAPVLKHFPGHGGTDAGFESAGIPTSSYDLSSLEGALKPFSRLLERGGDEQQSATFVTPAVMTSHFLAKSISDQVVTFDRRIITDLLQGKDEVILRDRKLRGLGFDGLVIADNLLAPSINAVREKCSENLDAFEARLFESAKSAFEAGHHMLMFSHVLEDSADEDVLIVPEGGRDNKTCARWAMTISEFRSLFNKLKSYIFDEKDLFDRQERVKKFKEAIVNIIYYKEKIDFSEKSLDDYLRVHESGEIDKCSQDLFNKTFVLRKPVEGGSVFSSARADDKVVVFMPSRWPTYQSIQDLKSKENKYEDQILKEISAYDWPREINRYFGGRNQLVFELEKLNPARSSEWAERASTISDLVLEKYRADYVLFIVNKVARWGVTQHAILELEERGFNIGNINVLVTGHPTMLRYIDPQISKNKNSLRDVVYIIAYSGYGRRAGILMSQLRASNGSEFSASPPIEIPGLFGLSDSNVSDSGFSCQGL